MKLLILIFTILSYYYHYYMDRLNINLVQYIMITSEAFIPQKI